MAQPHVPATATGTSPHPPSIPHSPPKCPAGAPEHNPEVRTFLGRGENSCRPQDVTRQVRKRVNLLSYKQRNLIFHLRRDQPTELNGQPTAQRHRQQLQAGIWVFFTLPSKPECWNQPVQRSVPIGIKYLQCSCQTTSSSRAAAPAPGALPRVGRKGGSAAPLGENPSGTSRAHYVTQPQPDFRWSRD